MDPVGELLAAGDLEGARKTMAKAVGAQPSNDKVRLFYADMLLADQQYEKVDDHLGLISAEDPTMSFATRLRQQLVRGMIKRQEVFAEGRPPEFRTKPEEAETAALKRLVKLRQGSVDEGAPPIADSTPISGEVDGQRFSSLRDLDDVLAPVLECIDMRGVYYWIPWRDLIAIDLKAPRSLIDTILRPATLRPTVGDELNVFIPVIYPHPSGDLDPGKTKLGHITAFDRSTEVIRGIGQKTLGFDQGRRAVMEIQMIVLDNQPLAPGGGGDAAEGGEPPTDA